MRYPTALLTCVLALACTPDAPTTPSDAEFAAAEVTHGPFAMYVRLSDGGYSVYIGMTQEELATSCATGGSLSATPWEEVAVYRGQNDKLHVREKGRDLPVVVYRAPFYEVCDETLPVFASGTANVVYTDNDWFLDGPGVESFGFTANGIVTTPTGDDYRLHAQQRTIVHDPEFREKATLNLTALNQP